MPPLVIIEGPEAALEHAVQGLSGDGWTVVAGFAPPTRSGRSVRVGEIATRADAEAALLVTLGGEGLIARATAPREVVDRLVDDLRRLGSVDHRIGLPDTAQAIRPEARGILGLLAEGHSLGEAAAILGLSRRTADRRLAEGRRALGVQRTTEAVARARRLGWLGQRPG